MCTLTFFASPCLVAGRALVSRFGLGWLAWAVRSALSPFQVLLCSLHFLASASAARGHFPFLLSRLSLPLSLLFSPGRLPVLPLVAQWGRILSFSLPSRLVRSRACRSSLPLAPVVAVLVRSLLSPLFLLLLVPVLPLPGGLVVVSLFLSGCVLPAALLRWFASLLTCPQVRRGLVLLLSFASFRPASPVVRCWLAVLPLVSACLFLSSVSVSLPPGCLGSVVARGIPFRLLVILHFSGSPAHRSCFSSEGGQSH